MTTRRLVCCYHSAEVLVMVVIGKPDPMHNFNDKISLVNKLTKNSANKLTQYLLLHKPRSPPIYRDW